MGMTGRGPVITLAGTTPTSRFQRGERTQDEPRSTRDAHAACQKLFSRTGTEYNCRLSTGKQFITPRFERNFLFGARLTPTDGTVDVAAASRDIR